MEKRIQANIERKIIENERKKREYEREKEKRRKEVEHFNYISELRREKKMIDINPDRLSEINTILEREDKKIEQNRKNRENYRIAYAELLHKATVQAAKIEKQKIEKAEELEKQKLKKEEEKKEKGDWKKQAEKLLDKAHWYVEEEKRIKGMPLLTENDVKIQKQYEKELARKLNSEPVRLMMKMKIAEAKKKSSISGGKTKKKIYAVEKRLKTRCIRYRKGKCIRYTKKQLKLIMALRKDYKAQKKTQKKTQKK